MTTALHRQARGSDAETSKDEALLDALRLDRASAAGLLFDRYERDVNRLVGHILGPDPEHDDVVQQAFLAILRALPRLREPAAVRGWVASIAVNTARTAIRRRRMWKWIRPARSESETVEPGQEDDHQGRAEVCETYRLLDRLSNDERIVFVLRYISGKSLQEVADSAGCSLATVKRRLKRAEGRFVKHAMKNPVLADRIREGGRWPAT